MNPDVKLKRKLLKNIKESFLDERIVIIYGARQDGKTTSSLDYFDTITEEKK